MRAIRTRAGPTPLLANSPRLSPKCKSPYWDGPRETVNSILAIGNANG